jgi:prepilin-type N-terminal cleavage/methylation domain-containing protein
MNNQFLRTSVRSLSEIDTERTCYTRTLKSAVLWQRMYKGLTLIECLISLILLTILLVGGIALYFCAHQFLRWSTNKEIAIGIADSEMEDIKNNGYSCLPEPAPTGGLWTTQDSCSNNIIHTRSISITSFPSGNLTGQQNVFVDDNDANGDGSTDYKEVRVSITWQPGKNATPETVSLVTDIAP